MTDAERVELLDHAIREMLDISSGFYGRAAYDSDEEKLAFITGIGNDVLVKTLRPAE